MNVNVPQKPYRIEERVKTRAGWKPTGLSLEYNERRPAVRDFRAMVHASDQYTPDGLMRLVLLGPDRTMMPAVA